MARKNNDVILFRLPVAEKDWLMEYAAEQDLSASHLLRRWIRQAREDARKMAQADDMDVK